MNQQEINLRILFCLRRLTEFVKIGNNFKESDFINLVKNIEDMIKYNLNSIDETEAIQPINKDKSIPKFIQYFHPFEKSGDKNAK